MKTTAKTTTKTIAKTSCMIRKLCSIALVLFCTMSLQARSVLVATLYHTANDSTSVYYGIEAFKKAYDASTDGDVITLSSGAFTACAIKKEITIRGAGMEADTINHIAPTILLGDCDIYFDNPSPKSLTMEGIFFEDWVRIGKYGSTAEYHPEDVHFIKCRMNVIGSNNPSCSIRDGSFTQCRIKRVMLIGNASFYNCIVADFQGGILHGGSRSYGVFEFVNCVVRGLTTTTVPVYNSIFYNCALNGSNPLDATNVAHHCVGYYSGSTENTNLFSNLSAAVRETNHSFTSAEAIFKTFPGGSANVTDTETFELQDSIKTKYLGSDSTQVGIYGGPAPFSPKTTLPVVSRFKVASKSDESGKLKVEMQVNTPQ